MTACVEIAGYVTDVFTMENGIRQGDVLAPTMFNIYVDSLLQDIKASGLGVQFGDELISALMYADDLTIMASTEEDLQTMINVVHEWCLKWRLQVNVSKTNVVHLRPQRVEQTGYEFTFGDDKLPIVTHLKYLGMEHNEHLDYTATANALAESSSKALGSLIAKLFQNKGLRFTTYEHLFRNTVMPIMEYAAEIWGYKYYCKLETVVHRAIKAYLGVGKMCPTPVILGDTGWGTAKTRRRLKIIHQWNKLMATPPNKLTHKVFIQDIVLAKRGKNTWAKDVNRIMSLCDMPFNYQMEPININVVTDKLNKIEEEEWRNEMQTMTKLNVYKTFKQERKIEPYVTAPYLNYRQRRVLASARAGTLPLEIERGRWRGIPAERRICKQCEMQQIETVEHFMLECPYNQQERVELFNITQEKTNINTNRLQVQDLLCNSQINKYVSDFIIKSFHKQRN